MSKFKKVSEWLISIFVVIVFIFSAVALISVINGRKTGVNSVFGYTVNSVQSNSMEGTLNVGDLVIGKVYDGSMLQKDQIITYKMKKTNKIVFNTHRIVGIEKVNGVDSYKTQGDNEKDADLGFRSPSEIVSVYRFRIPFIGGFIDWMKTPVGFIICVILPIVAVILYEAYKIVSVILKAKSDGLLTEGTAEPSEEMKAKIIEQYLASQKDAKKEEGEPLLDADTPLPQENEGEESKETDGHSAEEAESVSDKQE